MLVLALALTVALAGARSGRAAADNGADLVVAAQRAYDLAAQKLDGGTGHAEEVYTWSVRLLDAQRARLKGRALGAAFKDHLGRMTAVATRVTIQFESGQTPSAEVAFASYYRLQAEGWAATKRR